MISKNSLENHNTPKQFSHFTDIKPKIKEEIKRGFSDKIDSKTDFKNS